MRLDAIQQLRLEQKLKLAPRMIQSMEILQLPLLALEERVEQELEKNPVLELRDGNSDTVEAPPEQPENVESSDNERELIVQDDRSNQEDFERLDNIERDIAPLDFADFTPRRAHFDDEDPKLQALSNTAAKEISLNEHLLIQWDLMDVDDLVKRCGKAIINNLDADGYFRTEFRSLSREIGQDVKEEVWEEALALVQKLDPPGVAARSVHECLLIQAKALGEGYDFERCVITDHFDELQKQQYSKIAQATGRDVAEVKDVIEFIRTRLVLHPGLIFAPRDVPYVLPDVIVDYNERDTGYQVTVPEERTPALYISGHYRRMLQDPNVDRRTKQFIRNNVQSANWLIEAIEQRRRTLKHVTEEIVKAQREFLENGPQHLKPLPMAQIADKVAVHVATVSRAVAGKYVQTPRGIFPLRMFFSGGTETASGESLSWDAVKAKIQEIVDKEDKTKPLSDDHIVEILKKAGIELARRTVSKYRKLMGIPSSVKRRES